MITIRNLEKRIKTLNVPELGSDMGTVSTSSRDPVSGAKGIVDREHAHAVSITLMPKGSNGDTSGELPDSVLESVEVKNAKTAGSILITRISSRVPLPEVPPEPIAGPIAPAAPAEIPTVARALRSPRASATVASTEKDS